MSPTRCNRIACSANRLLGLQPSTWAWVGVGFLVGLAIATGLWAIVAGRDVMAIVGDVLTFLTVMAAVIALRYAAMSAQAALDTVQPMKDMAAKLAASVDTLKNIEAGQDATARTMQANLELAQQIRADEARVATLERYLRVKRLHYRLRFAQERYEASKQVSLGAVAESGERLLTLLDDFRGAVAFLDKDEFKGAWEEANNIGFHSPQGLTGASGKALAEVEKALLELQHGVPGADSTANPL